jgi:hypothetical protein
MVRLLTSAATGPGKTFRKTGFFDLFCVDSKWRRGDEKVRNLFKQISQKKCRELNPSTINSSILSYEKDAFTICSVTWSRYGLAGRRIVFERGASEPGIALAAVTED